MWPFSRELQKRKGQPHYRLYALISLACTVAMIVGYAFADRLAALLPQSAWFWIPLALATLAAAFWIGRNGPDVRWVRRQWSKLRATHG